MCKITILCNIKKKKKTKFFYEWIYHSYNFTGNTCIGYGYKILPWIDMN